MNYSLAERMQAVLGLSNARSEQDLARLVERRLSTKVIRSLLRCGLTNADIYELVIPRRTLSHRKEKRERLTTEESDRAVRLARAIALAEQVFGEREKGLGWLRKSKRHFDDHTPLELLTTEAGAHLVEEALYQIDEGIFG